VTKLDHDILTAVEKITGKVEILLKAIPLQFYPMTWMDYAAGVYGVACLGLPLVIAFSG